MKDFLTTTIENEKFELLIDINIFPKDIVLKAAYTYLDKWYFFFSFNKDWNLIMQFTKKDNQKVDPKVIIWDFSDSLLEYLLRDKIEKDNKIVREIIVEKAINGPIDKDNFISFDDKSAQSNQVDFDKDIDDILSEIENDPDLKIDEKEIQSILSEIEEESKNQAKPNISVNISALEDMKKKFTK